MTEARRMLDLAARVALRAVGNVEPNPLVGAVIAKDGDVIGIGHHRVYGGVHAEVDALANCSARGNDPRGATMYVTLEPCTHEGKQPPCTDAILRSGLSRVVCARRDPNPIAMGGAERLESGGVSFEFSAESSIATRLADPFVKRVTTGMPWVIAKWAQTIGGRVGTRTGESKWISCDASRRRVHRLRARVDAIVTAIGTILADDPVLTARAGWKRRKVARRVVIDPDLEISETAMVLQTAAEAPLTIVCTDPALRAQPGKAGVLGAKGAEVMSVSDGDEIAVDVLLAQLVERYDCTNVMIESGPGLFGRLFDADLVDEAHVYIAPMLMGDEQAKPAARGRMIERLDDCRRLELQGVKRIENDVLLTYRRAATGP